MSLGDILFQALGVRDDVLFDAMDVDGEMNMSVPKVVRVVIPSRSFELNMM